MAGPCRRSPRNLGWSGRARGRRLVKTPTAAGGGFAMHGDIASTPRSSGEVRYDTAARTAAADDFGHLVHHTPRIVVLPRSADDVAATIREVGPLRTQVAAQGRRHSVWGRSQVRDGVVIDMS